MSYYEIVAAVVDILKGLVPQELHKNISESANIHEDLDIHSIKMVELVVELEDRFDIRLKNSDFPAMATVAGIADLIGSRLLQEVAS